MIRAFTNANVIDVIEQKIIPNCSVLVEDGIIKAIGAKVDTAGAEIVDITGKYLCPGLFNMHVHTTLDANGQQLSTEADGIVNLILTAIENLGDYIKGGATFVRDVGSFDFIFDLRDAVNSGRIKMAPDMQLSGHSICQTGGTMWYSVSYEADGVDECRKAARKMIRAGADWLKIMGTGAVVTRFSRPDATQFSVEEIQAIVEEGHKVGIKSCIHVQNDLGARNAIMAGVDVLEHGFILSDETIQLMLEHGTWLDPTLSAPYCIAMRSTEKEFVEKASAARDNAFATFRKAYRAGVPCVISNDCGSPKCYHIDTSMELVLMVEQCGLTPFEALYVGTMNGAKLCSVDHMLGSITVGKKAHFAVFEKDPIVDINNVRNNVMTIKNGEILWKKD